MAKIQGVHTPAQFKNLAINGAMEFFQRAPSSTQTAVTTVSAYVADMIVYGTFGPTAKSFVVSQSTNVPSFALSNFSGLYSYQFTNSTAIALGSTDYLIPFQYKVEGFDYQKIHGKIVTFSFWINVCLRLIATTTATRLSTCRAVSPTRALCFLELQTRQLRKTPTAA
jgi:hypothetical protein